MNNNKKKVITNYVDNKRLHDEIVKYKELEKDSLSKGLPKPKIPNYIAECLYKIANNFATKPSFMNYSFRDEMISDGIENCIRYFDGYDHVKYQNPFAYFTQIVYHAFLRRIESEEKNRYALYKNFQESVVNFGLTGLLVDSDDNNILPQQMYDNINHFMQDFEEKEERKKVKRKAAKEGLAKYLEE